MPDRGRLFVVSGPSGVGKDTVLEHFLPQASGFVRSVSVTTRPRRPCETEGVDYYFTGREEFSAMLRRGDILEHTVYNGSCYGTPREPVARLLDSGKNVVLKIEVDGAAQIRSLMPEAVLVFIGPPSVAVLEQRLRERSSESPEDQGNRLVIAKMELHKAKKYDYIIINEDLDTAVADLAAIVAGSPEAARCAVQNRQDYIREVCQHA